MTSSQYSCKNFRLCLGFQFRGKVAGQLSQLPVKDFDGVAMKGEALNSLTSATGEVDEDAQVNDIFIHLVIMLCNSVRYQYAEREIDENKKKGEMERQEDWGACARRGSCRLFVVQLVDGTAAIYC